MSNTFFEKVVEQMAETTEIKGVIYHDIIDPEYWSRVIIPLMLRTMEELEAMDNTTED